MIMTDSFIEWKFSIGTTLTSLDITQIRYLGGGTLIMRLEVSFLLLMTKLVGGHFSEKKTTGKVRWCGFYWSNLFKDAHLYCKNCPMY